MLASISGGAASAQESPRGSVGSSSASVPPSAASAAAHMSSHPAVSAVPFSPSPHDTSGGALAALPRTVRIQPLRFRSLTATEASARSKRYFLQASELFSRLQRLPEGDPDAPSLRAMALAASTQGTSLAELEASLSGRYDPSLVSSRQRDARSDKYVLTAVVPSKEVKKARLRAASSSGLRRRMPLPGDESDEDEEEVRRVLATLGPTDADVRVHADAVRVATLRAQPEVVASLSRTVLLQQWHAFKRTDKARQPHEVQKNMLKF
jgi:hypothetical protein